MAFECPLGGLTTGYGVQTKIFAPRIRNLGHDVSIQAFWGHEGAPISWNGIQIYGRGMHPYGQDIMAAHANNWHADVLISLMDAWVIETQNLNNIRWAPWFPIDSEPLPEAVKVPVSKAFKRLVFSQFGCRMMEQAGLDYEYIPHGVDTNIYKPMEREEAFERIHMPRDRFIVGMVAANKGNPPRKAFFANLTAFAKFHARHKDSLLYLHTMDGAWGGYEAVNLDAFCKSLGLERGTDVIFADQYAYMLGYPDDVMACYYNTFDVHLLVSMGEGFGIPILEAQACGCPVIVGDWTAMGELCFSGWKLDKGEAEPIWTNLQAYQFLPHADAIANKLEAAYMRRGNKVYREKARAGAMAYDADLVTEKYWKPALERMEAEIREFADFGKVAENAVA